MSAASFASSPASREAWATALTLSEALPDDLQGIFLMVARAAIGNEPCPSDAALARAYGSHSPRRARRLIAYFEERGLLVARTDFHGRRVLAFPDLGCETAPGHPDAADDTIDPPARPRPDAAHADPA